MGNKIDNDIKVKNWTIKELFESNLAIPEYQRAYTWEEKNLSKMLEDFEEFLNNKNTHDEYYMGTILLHQKDNNFNVIDGQQRITSLLLIAKILLKGYFRDIEYNNPRSQIKIKENYNYLISVPMGKIKEVIDKIVFTVIITKDEDDAFTFFDTQNSRGIQPSVLVLLKSFHLRCIDEHLIQKKCAILWEEHEKENNSYQLSEKSEKLEWLIKIFFYRVRNWRGNNRGDFGYYDAFRDSFTKDLRKTEKQEYKLFPNTKTQKIIANGFETIIREQNKDWFDFAVRQPIYQGEGFFKFVNHYSNLLDELMDMEIYQGKTFESFLKVHKVGSVYMASFLTMVSLTYYDRFGKDRIDEFIRALDTLLVNIRLESSRILKQTLEIQFIRCENENIEHNILDFICGAFDAQEVIEWIGNRQIKSTLYKADNTVQGRFSKEHKKFGR